MRSSAGSFSFTVDALGSTALLTDSAEAKAATCAYDAWGNTITMTGAQAANNKWEYAGGDHDAATGFTKLGVRRSNPVIGRFTQVDPRGRPRPDTHPRAAIPSTQELQRQFWESLSPQSAQRLSLLASRMAQWRWLAD
ncbi:RHS repeat-associated core domain-containing protein [Salinibacterium sp. ZJ454]|uniref:RHS repeat domain-containing protein n=1 Tax=Salinibacterium sp. ZJ454 TaxID=2708339 RepID=UPI00141EF025|nr:RHS repeat-associated core domain-containing protein [Salinibacterium sp. ZJ454]